MMRTIITILSIILFTAPTYAEEPDFFIFFKSCKTTVGYLVLSDESIKTMDGIPTRMSCYRRGENISCVFMFEGGAEGVKGNTEKYKIGLDSPPLLYFSTENYSEFMAVNTSQHAAVLTTRVVALEFSGSKICQGLFVTSSQVKALDKK